MTANGSESEQFNLRKKTSNAKIIKLSIPRCLLIFIVITFFIFCGAFIFFAIDEFSRINRYSELGIYPTTDDHAMPPVKTEIFSVNDLTRILGQKPAKLFAKLDRDGNGLISLSEFEPLVHNIRQNPHHPIHQHNTLNVKDKEGFELISEIGPLHTNRTYIPNHLFPEDATSIEEILSHTLPTRTSTKHRVAEGTFRAFIPWSSSGKIRPGHIYPLLRTHERLLFFTEQRRDHTPGRYFAPHEQDLLHIIEPLHPNIFLYPKGGCRDSLALVRDLTESYIDIIFRLHFDFQLLPPGEEVGNVVIVWLIPSGLEGRIIMSHDARNVIYFSAQQSSTSVGIEWNTINSSLSGYASTQLAHLNITAVGSHIPSTPDSREAIPLNDAWKTLRATAYPMRALEYHNLTQMMSSIKDPLRSHPIHLVITVGSLLDQSCVDKCIVMRDLILSSPNLIILIKYEFVNVLASMSDIESMLKSSTLEAEDRKVLEILQSSFKPSVTSVIIGKDATVAHTMDDFEDVVTKFEKETLPRPNRKQMDEQEALSAGPQNASRDIAEKMRQKLVKFYTEFLELGLKKISYF